MITSQEVNAMIAMQQQQQSMGMGGMYAQPGASQYPPQFNYGVGVGHGGPRMASSLVMGAMGVPAQFGERIIGTAGNILGVAGLGGMAAGKLGFSGVSGALGKVASHGMLNTIGNLDPTMAAFSGATTGWAAAGSSASIAARLGGAATGMFSTAGLLNPYMLAAQAAIFGGVNMYRGHQQQAQIGASLNQAMPFANPMAYDGRGFSATQVNRITSGVRALDTADPFTSMRELTNLTSKFTEMGMAEGIRSAEEFSKKFSAMKTAVSRIAKTLGTTLEQATQAFAGFRSSGLYTAADVTGMSSRMRMMQGMGMGQGTFMQAAAGGASMAQQSGMARRSGALASTALGGMFMTGTEMGLFSGEDLMDATGAASGAEGAAALGQQTTASMIGFLQNSAAGQAVLLALGEKDSAGRYTGKINKGTAAGLSAGTLNINNLSSTARANLGNSKDARLSFTNRSADIAADLMAQEDPTLALTSIVKSIAGDRYGELGQDDLIELLMKNMAGMDRKQAQLFAKAAKEGERILKERRSKLRAEMNAEFYEQDMRMNHSLDGSLERLKQTVGNYTSSPVQQAGGILSTGVENMMQGVGDYVYNRERIVSNEGMRDAAMRDALVGGSLDAVVSGGSNELGISGAGGLSRQANYALSRGNFSAIDSTTFTGEDAARYQLMLSNIKTNKRAITDAQANVGKQGLLGAAGTERDVLDAAMSEAFQWNDMATFDKGSAKDRLMLSKALREAGITKAAQGMAQVGGAIGARESAKMLREQTEGAFESGGYRTAFDKAGERSLNAAMYTLGGSLMFTPAIYEWSYMSDKANGSVYDQLQEVGAGQVAGEISKGISFDRLLKARDTALNSNGDFISTVNKELGTSFKDQAQFDKVFEVYENMGDTDKARSAFGTYAKNTAALQKGADFLELATSLSGSSGSFDSDEFDALRAAASAAASGAGGDVYGNVDAFLESAGKDNIGDLGTKGTIGQAAAEALARKNAILGTDLDADALKKVAGLSEEDVSALLESKLVNFNDGVDDTDRKNLAASAARKTFLERFQSGGMIVTNGVERTQLQLAQEMNKLTQATDALVNKVTGTGSSGVSITSPIGSATVSF